ncbi:MAG: toll/interleukin-1 receptor domain-containing protein [Clostridiales bacterium]|nr:toll/interleukin-1 receptor domain-containing protein [Clostridiales bacterium]
MKFYIALGGIGCETLLEAAPQLGAGRETRMIYCDTDKRACSKYPAGELCLIPNFSGGFAGNMDLGRSFAFMDSISELDHFFDGIAADETHIELVFILSSFGGFGAGAVISLAERIVRMLRQDGREVRITTRIIAFSHEFYAGFFPGGLYDFYRRNTEKLLEDYSIVNGRRTLGESTSLFLVYSPEYKDHLADILLLEDSKLEKINRAEEESCAQKNFQNIFQNPLWNSEGTSNAKGERYLPPYKGEKPYVFISYAHRDMAETLPVIRHLQEQGIRVWYDEGIDPGTEWSENIASHIVKCHVFIAMISAFYIDSSNCRDELDFARDRVEKRLLIFLRENVEMPDGMRMRTGRLQNIHKYKYADEAMFYKKLMEMDGLAECSERTCAKNTRPASRPASVSEHSSAGMSMRSDFTKLLQQLYEILNDFRDAIRESDQELLNATHPRLHSVMQKIYVVSERSRYSDIQLSKRAASIVARYNALTESFNQFANCSDRLSVQAQNYAGQAEDDFRALIDIVVKNLDE